MFVKPGIYKVDCTDGSYVYAIKNEHGVSLIDTHFPGKGEQSSTPPAWSPWPASC